MFFVQLRSFCKAHRQPKIKSIQQLKKVVLKSIRSQYEAEYSNYDAYGPGDIEYEEKFYNAFYNFATSCRMNGKEPLSTLTNSERNVFVNKLKISLKSINKQVIDWSKFYEGNLNPLRKVRSALAFLEEDVISREKELSNSVDWRILKNEGIFYVDEALVYHASSDEWHPKIIDLRTVPYSHNWWNHGKYTFKDSEERFGDTLEKDDRNPILPMIEVLESEDNINVKNTDWVSNLPEGYIYIIDSMFQRHLRMRKLSIHPISIFSYKGFSEKGFLQTLQHLDILVSYACDHPEEISPLVVRSAIQFMEEELVPFIFQAEPIWHEFLNGNGMRRLNEFLQKQWIVPSNYENLETVPSNHTWWPERCRKNSNKQLPITFAFDEHRERMLCYLQQFSESRGRRTFIKNFYKFNKHYVNYVRMCLKYKQDPLEMLGRSRMEFESNLPHALDRMGAMMKRINYNKNSMDIFDLRCMRSSIEFLKEQEKGREEFQKIISGDALKELDEVLKERSNKDFHFIEWQRERLVSRRNKKMRLLDGIPKSHTWWTEKDFNELGHWYKL